MKGLTIVMKRIALSLFACGVIFMGGIVQAQLDGFADANIQQMMQEAKKMEACIKNVDHDALDKLINRGAKLEETVKELCSVDGRDEAQLMAVDYIKEVESSKELAALRECGTMASKMMGDLPLGINSPDSLGDDEHVCDIYVDESADEY